MPALKARQKRPARDVNAALSGLLLLTLLGLAACSPVLINQQDHGLSVHKALDAQRLPATPRNAARPADQAAASELKPAYDRYLLPPPTTPLTPQLP